MITRYYEYINEQFKPSDEFINRKLADKTRNFEDGEIVVCLITELPYYRLGHRYIVDYWGSGTITNSTSSGKGKFTVKDIVNNERNYNAMEWYFISEFEYEHGEDQESYNI
jgi:hypothetical protein